MKREMAITIIVLTTVLVGLLVWAGLEVAKQRKARQQLAPSDSAITDVLPEPEGTDEAENDESGEDGVEQIVATDRTTVLTKQQGAAKAVEGSKLDASEAILTATVMTTIGSDQVVMVNVTANTPVVAWFDAACSPQTINGKEEWACPAIYAVPPTTGFATAQTLTIPAPTTNAKRLYPLHVRSQGGQELRFTVTAIWTGFPPASPTPSPDAPVFHAL